MLEVAAEHGDKRAERLFDAMDKDQGIFKKSSGRKALSVIEAPASWRNILIS